MTGSKVETLPHQTFCITVVNKLKFDRHQTQKHKYWATVECIVHSHTAESHPGNQTHQLSANLQIKAEQKAALCPASASDNERQKKQ